MDDNVPLFPSDQHVPEPQLDNLDITATQLRLFLMQAGVTPLELHHVFELEPLRTLAKECKRRWHVQRVLACKDAKTPQHLMPPGADRKAEKYVRAMVHSDHITDPGWKADADEAFKYVQEVLKRQDSIDHVLDKMRERLAAIGSCKAAVEVSALEVARLAATVADLAVAAKAAACAAYPSCKARAAVHVAEGAAKEAAGAASSAKEAAAGASAMGEAAHRYAMCAEESYDEGAKLASTVFGNEEAEGLLAQITTAADQVADAVSPVNGDVSAAQQHAQQAADSARLATVMAEAAAAAVFPDGYVSVRPEAPEVLACQAGSWQAGVWLSGTWLPAGSLQEGSWPGSQQELEMRWEAMRVLACEEAGRPDWLVAPGSTLVELHAQLLSDSRSCSCSCSCSPRDAELMQRAADYVDYVPATCVRSVLLKHGAAAAQRWVYEKQRDLDLLAGQPPCDVLPGCRGTMRVLPTAAFASCTECKACVCTHCGLQLSRHGFGSCCPEEEGREGREGREGSRNVRPRWS